jgi:hypothetical protein
MKMALIDNTTEINMLNQLSTFTAANAVVVFIFAVLLTQHVCLFFDLSRFQKMPLSDLNYFNAGLLSALITTGCFFTLRLPSLTHKIVSVAAIGFLAATVITLTLQRLVNKVLKRG